MLQTAMQIPIVSEMLLAAGQSVENLRQSIRNVYSAGFTADFSAETFTFEVSGDHVKPEARGNYLGELRGRNRDLCLGFGEEKDRAIALRVWLDGDARKI